jgi:hypothetical protein
MVKTNQGLSVGRWANEKPANPVPKESCYKLGNESVPGLGYCLMNQMLDVTFSCEIPRTPCFLIGMSIHPRS